MKNLCPLEKVWAYNENMGIQNAEGSSVKWKAERKSSLLELRKKFSTILITKKKSH